MTDEPGLLAKLLGERFGQRHAEAERVTAKDTPEQVAQRRRVLTDADRKDVKRRT
jgi:hypothetical protein